MLTSLHLKNFVIVNEAELDLGPGMTAITGETGAGKSILVDALNLALGDRVSGDVIRHGQDKAEITALFDLADCSIALQWLRDQELDEGDECIIRRVISRNSSSRGFINGRPVVMQQLKQIGDLLVDIHGQHEHQSLLRPADQREILDAVAGHDQELGVLAGLYDEIHQCRQQLDTLYAMSGSDDAQLDLLRYQVNELEQLELDANGISSLEEEHRRLANSSDLINGANENLGRLSSDEPTDIEQQLGQSINHLQQMEKLDPSLGEVSKLLVNASIQVDEAIRQLRQYIEQMDTDPQRFAWVNERMGTIHDLARKHRVTTTELPTQLEHLKQQLMDLENSEHRIIELKQELSDLNERFIIQADKVSENRRAAADKLSADVSKRMQTLGMEGGHFSIDVNRNDDQQPRRHGLDSISYLVAANPGQAAQPLNKVASGGELSRIALALQVCIMESATTATLIFDEIDVGIGGRVAEIVGKHLAKLGKVRQVLCITHLAQVAANADQQILISKSGDPVTACISSLSDDERVKEIARMIGGIEITEQTLAHAEEMLQQGNG